MTLTQYLKKRDFKVTREPRGGKGAGKKKGRSFVVQKHAARRLHYDFRLELDGVLVSWAVPRGPSLDPREKRLAVKVEDHPVEYGKFEGTIPEGEYGAGVVLLWDRGAWEPKDDDPGAALKKGKLSFELHGRKLRGGWTLVRMGGRQAAGKENWLLIKERDDSAVPREQGEVLVEHPESVATGRTIEEIAAGETGRVSRRSQPSVRARSRPAGRPGARKPEPARGNRRGRSSTARLAALPENVSPQLATLVSEVPTGDDWLHEIKFDGYRILGSIRRGEASFYTRRRKDWTRRFASLAPAASSLPLEQGLLDGEVVVFQPDGSTSFQALQNALSGEKEVPLVYQVFDLLHLDGRDLMEEPLRERKAVLARLLGSAKRGGPIRYTDHVVGNGPEFHRQACQHGLEGVVSKLAEAPYRPGRSMSWRKTKCFHSQELVIGGFTDPTGSRTGLGSLLLGVHDAAGNLVYCGRVGTGFTRETLHDLRAKLARLEQTRQPFKAPPPRSVARRAHWVKPRLVAEVQFLGWTRDGMLRHPSFQGLREDIPPGKVVRETPVASNPAPGVRTEVAGVRLTHPDRVLYPDAGITKAELAAYYAGMADRILPHLEGRPLALLRCPEGQGAACFFQKHAAASFPESLARIRIREARSAATYVTVESLEGLIALVQLSVLELHTWGSRRDDLEHPDRMSFDLDPGPGVAWDRIADAARRLQARLARLGLASFLKTTGGKGLHVVVPLRRRNDWDEVKDFSRAIAAGLAREAPDRYTTNMSKAKRRGKIFIDYLRNARGATAIAAYSTRARPGAPVSVPLAWDELGPDVRSDHFNVRNLPGRTARLRRDPWAGYASAGRAITAAMKKAVAIPSS